MNWIIQRDSGLDIEELLVLEQLRKTRLTNDYRRIYIEDTDNWGKGYIPVGTIEFVERYLRSNYGIEQENPIEIPGYLQTDEFLKREYSIVSYGQIPDNKKFFLKDASKLKAFAQEIYDPEQIADMNLDINHKYVVSELVNVLSEYRIYVIDGKIVDISCYNGDCTLSPDVRLLNKATGLISINEKWLKSYTVDVMITNKGTSLIEIHNFTSVGLYSTIWGTDLLYGYRQGMDYLINDNRNRFNALVEERKALSEKG